MLPKRVRPVSTSSANVFNISCLWCSAAEATAHLSSHSAYWVGSSSFLARHSVRRPALENTFSCSPIVAWGKTHKNGEACVSISDGLD